MSSPPRTGSPRTSSPPRSSSPRDRVAEAEEEEEGEALDDTYEADYKAIPGLDQYDPRDLDEDEYDTISPSVRAAAEESLRQREFLAQSRDRGPALLNTPTDDEEEAARRERRRIREEGPGEGGGEDRMEVEDEGEITNLDDFKGANLREYISGDRPRREVRRRFRQFVQEFRGQSDHNIYVEKLHTMCADNKQSLEVSYLHLSQAVPILAFWLADEPAPFLELFNQELDAMVLLQYPSYEKIHRNCFVRITHIPVMDSIRDLREVHLNSLVKVEGVVTRRSSVFPQLKLVTYNCEKCQAVLGPYTQQSEKETRPARCPECQKEGPFSLNIAKTIYQNYQKITLQESPGLVPAGRIPRQKDVILTNDLIDSVSPGEEIEMTGIYRHSYDNVLNTQNGFPVFNTSILANYVTKKSDLFSSLKLTDEDHKMIERLSKKPNIGQIIINSLAPSIFGHHQIKTALALAMFGGQAKDIDNKQRIRGDINVLILGDPGTAKSQFLKYISKTAHRAVYTTGKGATAVGLTASVRRDQLTREWTLEGGALVLADQGVCLIDEFDKMNDHDRTSIHEAMEQQSISVSKAGIVTSLKARCSVIAAANPVKGRYDSQATFPENVQLTEAILSRFDILCVVKDQISRDVDAKLAAFVIDSHIQSHPNYLPGASPIPEEKIRTPGGGTPSHISSSPARDGKGQDGKGLGAPSPRSDRDRDRDGGEMDLSGDSKDLKEELISQEVLRKYVMYAKKHCKPKLTYNDDDKIGKLYQDLRRESAVTGGISITVRHIESMVRMSEAHARMHLRDHVTEEDVNLGISVMIESFISTQKFAVKNQMEKYFRKYLTKTKDTFELLLYTLNILVKEEQQVRLLRPRRTGTGEDRAPIEIDRRPIEIRVADFQAKARELQISNIQPFLRSELFRSNGFSVDSRMHTITKNFDTE